MGSSQNKLYYAVSQGLLAAKQNIVPAIVLWISGLTILITYFYVPATAQFWEGWTAFRSKTGLSYPILATAIAGGLLPFCLQIIQGKDTKRNFHLSYLLFLVLFWGYKGIEVEYFYRFQSWLFGDSNDGLILIQKLFVDQFLYCPLYVIPTMLILYHCQNVRFDIKNTMQWVRTPEFLNEYISTTIVSWCIWIPAVAIIYTLPLPLQLPIQNVVLALFSLILMVLTKRN